MAYDRDDLLTRLAAGEWLRPGAAAYLLGVDRRTAHNMINDGRLGWGWHGGGKQKVINPDSLRARLDEIEQARNPPPHSHPLE